MSSHLSESYINLLKTEPRVNLPTSQKSLPVIVAIQFVACFVSDLFDVRFALPKASSTLVVGFTKDLLHTFEGI